MTVSKEVVSAFRQGLSRKCCKSVFLPLECKPICSDTFFMYSEVSRASKSRSCDELELVDKNRVRVNCEGFGRGGVGEGHETD
jgi:hypothetical protein